MPRIIDAPVKTRTNSRGITQAEVQEYIDLLNTLEQGQVVEVDDSEGDTYDKAYVKGERVRIGAKKYELLPEGKSIRVISFEREGKWYASVAWKDEKVTETVAEKVEETK